MKLFIYSLLFLIAGQISAQELRVSNKTGIYISQDRIGQKDFKYCDLNKNDELWFVEFSTGKVCVEYNDYTGWIMLSDLSQDSKDIIFQKLTLLSVAQNTGIYSMKNRIGSFSFKTEELVPGDLIIFEEVADDKVRVFAKGVSGWLNMSDLDEKSQSLAQEHNWILHVKDKTGLYTEESVIGTHRFKYNDLFPTDNLLVSDVSDNNVCVKFDGKVGWIRKTDLDDKSKLLLLDRLNEKNGTNNDPQLDSLLRAEFERYLIRNFGECKVKQPLFFWGNISKDRISNAKSKLDLSVVTSRFDFDVLFLPKLAQESPYHIVDFYFDKLLNMASVVISADTDSLSVYQIDYRYTWLTNNNVEFKRLDPKLPDLSNFGGEPFHLAIHKAYEGISVKEKKEEDSRLLNEKRAKEKRAAQQKNAAEKRLKYLEDNFSKKDVEHILNRTVYIGMSITAARESWGTPEHASKTTTEFGTVITYLYGEYSQRSLRFENNILTIIRE